MNKYNKYIYNNLYFIKKGALNYIFLIYLEKNKCFIRLQFQLKNKNSKKED